VSRPHAAAGARDRLVTIQFLTEGQGGSGYPSDTWATLATVWAHKDDISARERFSFTANQETAPYDTRWTIPWTAAMDPDTVDVPKARRLIIHGRIHDIVRAVEIGRHDAIDLETQAGGPAEPVS